MIYISLSKGPWGSQTVCLPLNCLLLSPFFVLSSRCCVSPRQTSCSCTFHKSGGFAIPCIGSSSTIRYRNPLGVWNICCHWYPSQGFSTKKGFLYISLAISVIIGRWDFICTCYYPIELNFIQQCQWFPNWGTIKVI